MRQMISGLIAALAVVAASAVPAMACGGGCSPCGQAYVSPCAQPQVYVAPVQPVYSGCNSCGWAHDGICPDSATPRAPAACSPTRRRLPRVTVTNTLRRRSRRDAEGVGWGVRRQSGSTSGCVNRTGLPSDRA